jgi:diguanylate cyclase (GGDEF)-like protein
MIEKEFNEIIEQEYAKVAAGEGGFLLAKYNNEFSIKNVELSVEKNGGVRVYSYDLEYRELILGVAPFMQIIKDTIDEKLSGDIDEFLEMANIYPLQRELIASYLRTGHASRKEELILSEFQYEKYRLFKGVVSAIRTAARLSPFIIIINRMQIAPYGLLRLLMDLEADIMNSNFAVVLGYSNSISTPAYTAHIWEEFQERLDDSGRIVNIGSAEKSPGFVENVPSFKNFGKKQLDRLSDIQSFMDTNTVDYYVGLLNRYVEENHKKLSEPSIIGFFKIKGMNAILKNDTQKALECLNYVKDSVMNSNPELILGYLYFSAKAYMYDGALKAAGELVDACLMEQEMDDEWRFRFDMLRAMIKMGAWLNVYFFRENIDVPEKLMKEIEAHGYYNHLAYFNIYAFDNDESKMRENIDNEPEHLKCGLEIAKRLDNTYLQHMAYEKNVMMASSYGLNDVAIAYFFKEQKEKGEGKFSWKGHIYSGIGYNLSALGHYTEADRYYDMSLQEYFKQGSTIDIAEVMYNKSMNRIVLGDYYGAEIILNVVLKIIRHLRLNRIRVCNISKIYGLLALVSMLQDNRFSCEQHLKRCHNFLSYYMNRDYSDVADYTHDYTNYDDEILLYYLSGALMYDSIGQNQMAEKYYRLTDKYMKLAKGNGYFCMKIYIDRRINFEERRGAEKELAQILSEKKDYDKENKARKKIDLSRWTDMKPKAMTKEPSISALSKNFEPFSIRKKDIDNLIEIDEYRKADEDNKRLRIFMEEWQENINTENINPVELVKNAMGLFKGYFSVDHCMYIRRQDDGKYTEIYNDTGVKISDFTTINIGKLMMVNQRGVVISKISNEYDDYNELLRLFGGEKVCSLVMIPFVSGDRIEHIFITYIKMRENWFSMLNHYLLDYQDMEAFRLLFREIVVAIQRIEGIWKIREMNRELYQSAVTDQLTCVRNRNGLYSFIDEVNSGNRENFRGHGAVLFIDLDNFKAYNDYYGHASGDIVLKKFAELFTSAVGEMGVVARYGGDEFVIVLSTDDENIITDIIEEIFVKVEAAQGFKSEVVPCLEDNNYRPEPGNISCSIGVAVSGRDGGKMDISSLIRHADRALYEVKNETKGTYKFSKD